MAKYVRVNTTNETSLERGSREIGKMLTDLRSYLAKRTQRTCPICSEEEWMDPGEYICWNCNRCRDALKTLSRPLTKKSSAQDRALHEVVNWMQDVPSGQERSPQEIQNHLDELRASYTWSSGKQYTKQDDYQDRVLTLLHLALDDMNLFFRRLALVREYCNQLSKEEKAEEPC